jgi:hypothetical protein
MEAAEQQYRRDIARIEAHRLALKDDEFGRLVDYVKDEFREHAVFIRDEKKAPIILNDHDTESISVENADGLRSATVKFDPLRHQIDVDGTRAHYVFTVEIDKEGKPVVMGRKAGQPMGSVEKNTIRKALHGAIDYMSGLPTPIAPKR